jgi:hypothetical protein
MSRPITIVVDELELELEANSQPKTQSNPHSNSHLNTQSNPHSKCPTNTKPLYCTSKYGNFCVEKVLDVGYAVSDHDSNAQCCDCMTGFICLPFLPAMCICDVITYPIRRLANCCVSKQK